MRVLQFPESECHFWCFKHWCAFPCSSWEHEDSSNWIDTAQTCFFFSYLPVFTTSGKSEEHGGSERDDHGYPRGSGGFQRERTKWLHKADLLPPQVSIISIISAEGKVGDSKYSILPTLVHAIHRKAYSKKKRDPHLPRYSKLLSHLIYYWPKQSEILKI